jgi:cystathionine beta-lyase
MAGASFDFESLTLEWLRTKPGQKWAKVSPLLAAWVADMDFAPAPAIVAHLRSVLDSGDVGYSVRDEKRRTRAVTAFAGWMQSRHDWRIDTDRVREWNDVVQAIQAVLHVATSPGDGVIVHTPAYPPFFEAIEQTHCRLVPVHAHIEGDRVTFDHDALERQIAETGARVLLLCNPQNPTGRVFTRDELEHVVRLAVTHDLLIISDEIHADLVWDSRRHIPIASLNGAADRTVTITSASKSFNLAGLRYAVSHCGADWVEDRLAALPDHLFGATNIMGAEAAWAAWTHGAPWLDAAVAHLEHMRDLTVDLIRDQLPGVVVNRPEATYLAWLDCSHLGWSDPREVFRTAGVEVSPGTSFGPGGDGHVRLNFATSSAVIEEIVRSMAGAVAV